MFDAPRNAHVRRSIHLLYFGSGLLFLATITLGIVNVFTPGAIPHAQILAHFHSGTIGWVTLSVIATTIWAFTAGRDPGEGVASFTSLLAGIGLIAVAGYIAAFGLVFSGNGPGWMMPLFGVPAGLTILAAWIFTLQQRRHVTWQMPHLLLSCALLVASLGAIMGILNGLVQMGIDVFPAGGDRVGAHAGPMDMYLALAFTGIIEALRGGGTITGLGKSQAALGVISAFVANIALLLGIGPLIPAALLLFLASFIIFLIRMAKRMFGGFADGPSTHGTFGAIFLPIYFALFIFLVAAYYSQAKFPPHGLGVAFAHVTFVGMGTNLLLATKATFTPSGPSVRMGAFVMNLGLVLFIGEALMAGGRYSALVMAAGVLMSLGAVMRAEWHAMRSAG